MALAFRCDRCGKVSADMTKHTHYALDSDIAFLVADLTDPAPVDICRMCQSELSNAVMIWWNGLTPE